jgi:hypothetical protein
MGAFQLQGELARINETPPDPQDQQLDAPFWEHEDIKLSFPGKT